MKTTIGTILLVQLAVLAVVICGWVFNLLNVINHYPKPSDWQASNIVCTIGIVAVPVGTVCGYIDAGVVKK